MGCGNAGHKVPERVLQGAMAQVVRLVRGGAVGEAGGKAVGGALEVLQGTWQAPPCVIGGVSSHGGGAKSKRATMVFPCGRCKSLKQRLGRLVSFWGKCGLSQSYLPPEDR